MTIDTDNNRSGPYTANGLTTVFARDFRILDDSHLRVIRSHGGVSQDLTSGFTVDGIGADEGNVTFMVAPEASDDPQNPVQITLVRAVPLTQETDYSAQGRVSPEQVEDDLDLQEMQIQDLAERVDRSFQAPVTGKEFTEGHVPQFDTEGNLVDSDASAVDVLSAAVQAAASASDARDAAASVQPYSSRAEMLEADVPDNVTRIGWYSGLLAAANVFTLWIIRSDTGPIVRDDGSTWAPDGVIRPEHFAENTVPGVTDMGDAIRAAVAYGPTKLALATYATSTEIALTDGSHLTGESAYWKSRTTFVPKASSIIKYIGDRGALTSVVRISDKPVGEKGDTFWGFDTDDISDVTVRDFHVDANGAHYGIYIYRAGNQSTIGNLTAEGAARANHIHMGCYAAYFGHFGSYESEDVGVICGENEFGWGSVEATNFAYRASFHLKNNGTNETFVEDSATDLDGCGGIFVCGRGSVIVLTSEGNSGRAYYAKTFAVGGGEGGMLTIEADYIEANAAGPKLVQTSDDGGLLIQNGFVHPGNGGSLATQTFKIEAQNISGVPTDDEGSDQPEQWIVLRNLIGGMQVNSNTDRYLVEGCDKDTVFLDRRPTDPYGKMQNLSINGDLSVWQRGTTFSANGYTADRLYLDLSGSTGTVTRQPLPAGALLGYNAPSPEYFAQLVSNGEGDNTGFIQKLAGVRRFSNKRLIISFWAKADSLKTFRVSAQQNFGSGGSTTVEQTAGDITVATYWQRFTTAIDVGALSGKTLGADDYFGLRIRREVADAFTLSIAAIAIESGMWGATLYEQRSYAAELAECLPYFQRLVSGDDIRLGEMGQAASGTQALFGTDYLATMRKVPTLSVSSVSHFETTRATAAGEALTGLSLSQAGVNSCRLVAVVATGLVAGNVTSMRSTNAAATLDLIAEV